MMATIILILSTYYITFIYEYELYGIVLALKYPSLEFTFSFFQELSDTLLSEV